VGSTSETCSPDSVVVHAEPGYSGPTRAERGEGALVGAGHQSAQWDNSRAGFPIEVHDDGAGSIEVSEHADAAAKADAVAYPQRALTIDLQRLVYVYPSPG
jgi:hypothetical protein